MKIGILNYTEQNFAKILEENDIPKFRASQIFSWIFKFGKSSFFEMSNISKNLQKILDEKFYIYRPSIENIAKSSDDTVKFLFKLFDETKLETVFLPEKTRSTICISSQVGCLVGCKFCNTGYNGFIRNLSTEEIVAQFLAIKDHLNLWADETPRLSNIVFMGMGEPLLNHTNVLNAVNILINDKDEGLSRRKITLSTSGISNILKEVAKNLNCRLAISLHAPNDEIRSKIMPINKKFNIESVIDACQEYSKYHKFLKITFEYLMLKNINDSKYCAFELVKLLKPLNAKVNLLQFNPWPGCDFEPSEQSIIKDFSKILERNGIEAPIRKKRGEDIMAACGQLSANNK